MQDTLSKRISQGKPLSEQERESALMILSKGCRSKTVNMLRYALSYVPNVPNYGIYDRVHISNGNVDYCAGQSYPDEIRTVRNLLIGR